MKEERLKRIVVHRLSENIETMVDNKIDDYVLFKQNQQYLDIYYSGQGINWICYKIFTGFPTDVYEIDNALDYMPSQIWHRYSYVITHDIAQYYKNKDNAKPWLRNNKILQRNTSIDDFISDDYDSDHDFILLSEEVESYYEFMRDFQNIEYNVLIYFTNEIIKQLELEVETKCKQLKMTKEKYLELLYIKISRMNQKKA